MSQPTTILVADDDAGFVKALSTRLVHAGFRVITASDGYSALAQAVKEKPDLLVLDIHMPAGNGFTVQQRKDKMGDLVQVPVIYITGDKTDGPRLQAAAHGALALLHKPLEFEELLEKIELALAPAIT